MTAYVSFTAHHLAATRMPVLRIRPGIFNMTPGGFRFLMRMWRAADRRGMFVDSFGDTVRWFWFVPGGVAADAREQANKEPVR